MRRETCSAEMPEHRHGDLFWDPGVHDSSSLAITPQFNTCPLAAPSGRPEMHAVPDVRQILGVNVAVLSTRQAIGLIADKVARRQSGMFAFCNAHTANVANRRPDLREALRHATVFNDGVGVNLASRVLYGASFPENLNGTDLTPALLDALPAGTPVFLLGSRPGVAQAAAALLEQRHGIKVVGIQHGYFSAQSEPQIAQQIARSGARLVIVAMGNPLQELWAARSHAGLQAPVLCVGAFLDFAAGRVTRAPQVVRDLRLEWVYRLMHEPRRLTRRYLLGNSSFLLAILQQRAGRRAIAEAPAPLSWTGPADK